jgi:putative aminopeptidase FrvX
MNQYPRLSVVALAVFLTIMTNTSLVFAQAAQKSSVPVAGVITDELAPLVDTPGISGYEAEVSKVISKRLAALHPVTDNMGNVFVTMGSGSPNRLIVTPIDEPGFVVSEITADGYLRVQRLPQFGLPPVFNELYAAQPVKIGTGEGKWIDGVVAGLSVHLQGAHLNAPKAGDLENFYVDIGAVNAAEVRRAGVDLLSPIVMNRRLMNLGEENAGASIGDRFGVAVVMASLKRVDRFALKGTLTVAFVVQQRIGARGLQRLLTQIHADEMIYVGRLLPGGPIPDMPTMRHAPRREPGSGVLIGVEKTDGALSPFESQLKQVADAANIPFATDYSAGILPSSYLPMPTLPTSWAHVAIATAWPDTPAEIINLSDLENLAVFLVHYIGFSPAELSASAPMGGDESYGISVNEKPPLTRVLRELTETYGVSERETPVLETVQRLLPDWAKTETDAAGNLILHLGTAPAATKTPSVLIVAHMDEIGFAVKSIANDGRLEVEWRGSGSLGYFQGHPALVHTSKDDLDAIVEPPLGWDTHDFKWPDDEPQKPDATKPIRVDVGARNPMEVAKLGISVGDTITIPKQYRPLLGTRANGRSFDDRVGDAALISAVWALGAPLKDRDVTFVWSTGEEEGLVGAAKLANRLAAEGHTPEFVFAVDTFVSSDSPLESKRFGEAKLGDGFVIRAIDSSNIARHDLVERVIQLARKNSIPVQYGVTAGGNDGSAFVRYGSADIPLGWALRYSHSPAEVVDTRDVDALGRIVAAIARSW